MELNKQEKTILKVLLEKELETVKKQGKAIFTVNSPFLGKVRPDKDLDFMTSELTYEEFLVSMLARLNN
tara:strand:- start:538 stop:744 length:207 start_codon:yes stop_codon:yes gene_type:complete